MSPQPAVVPARANPPRVPSSAPVAVVRHLPTPNAVGRGGASARPADAPEWFDPRLLDRWPAAGPLTSPIGDRVPAVGVTGAPARHGLTVDRSAWAAWIDGELLDLTYLEFEVLDFLVRHPGRAYSRGTLLRHVWGHRLDGEPGQAGRTVDVLVTRLRRKLGPEHRSRIETVRRVGYRYRPAPGDVSA
ncbi:winged helix-turn-helix transcriptional regulator [Frankia sp. CNm7]|uniref:Winged helix-turn-helix transcriptional regulator n=1 Tax=Frankia nepalensis TaxID=1836974 RepID=A0A937RCH3_9ACTN|nr:winged helix-turn-helix domain-containing protein [Frankia nepalensis]MBL7495384.1 winged helix-turn-helix transcriptional regulator [Frankia nepalensis]MBL7514784.1 winged helix-turn-helix transcriptional regulator [Frankia nepalensis]MBL7520895.1 winged helix-turn-helix transcriptional regulator [Frankia nepalensis]MBL7627727.1 winged helix-turn-helix transcriptional regulator [Frankia nepalensis]